MRDAAEQTSFTDDMRERIARYLDFATLSLERWPLKAIDFDTVADGLVITYRRARQLVPDDFAQADPEHLHDLRRRVVEHRHQMDLIEPLWPRLGQVWAEEAQRLRNRLGACQDLAMLTNFTAAHQPLAPWRSRLTPAIAARRAAHLKTAERLASRLFAEKPKAFRRVALCGAVAKRAGAEARLQRRTDCTKRNKKAAADATPRRLHLFSEGSSKNKTAALADGRFGVTKRSSSKASS